MAAPSALVVKDIELVELNESLMAGPGDESNMSEAFPLNCDSPKLDEIVAPSPAHRGVCWRWNHAWTACSRFILLDATYSYVWSKFLAFACLLTATIILSEENLAANLSGLPSSSRCSVAHHIGFCAADGHIRDTARKVDIVVNPVERTNLSLEYASLRTLRLVLVASLANSRFLEKLPSLLAVVLAIGTLCECCWYAVSTVSDLASCGRQNYVDWEAFAQKWAPAGDAPSNWIGPSPASMYVTEYCAVNAFGNHEQYDGLDAKDAHFIQALSSSVMSMWAAWMDAASFTLGFENRTQILRYCKMLKFPDWHACRVWLNSSAFGNTIHCEGGDLGTPLQHISFEQLMMLQELTSQEKDATEEEELKTLQAFVEIVELQELEDLDCRAIINGTNFGLGRAMTTMSWNHADAVAVHLLSLATSGWQCPASMALRREGLHQVAGSEKTCTYNADFVKLEHPEQPDARFAALNRSASYLQPTYFRCMGQLGSDCAQRAHSAYLTTFRSACQASCAAMILCGYLWVLFLRIAEGGSENFLSRLTAQRRQDVWHCISRYASDMRSVLVSRVMVGLIASFILQLGFTIVAHQVVIPWANEGKGRQLALSLKVQPLGLIDFLVINAIWVQFWTVTGAVIVNIILHFRLRRQIMALPREVFFGRAPAPAEYRGPNLEDLRWMASSSVVYAMYFPGMVFWHFFYASWMLVITLAVLVGLLVIVCQPVSARSPYAAALWAWLGNLTFVLSILLAHFFTRMFTQRCLLRQHSTGMEIRCLCLFSWYEVLFFFISFAVGPTAALYDFLKGFLVTMVVSLVIQKPNFTQLGECADYVYCTYCATLYLERVAEDQLADNVAGFANGSEVTQEDQAMELESPQAYHTFDGRDAVQKCNSVWKESEPMLMDDTFRSKWRCFLQTVGFLLMFLGLPRFVASLVNTSSSFLGYDCPRLTAMIPGSGCTLNVSATLVEVLEMGRKARRPKKTLMDKIDGRRERYSAQKLEDAIRAFFHSIDEDGSGFLEAHEFVVAQVVVAQLAEEDFDDVVLDEFSDGALFSKADADRDGRVDLKEFSRVMTDLCNVLPAGGKDEVVARFADKTSEVVSFERREVGREIREVFKALDKDDTGILESSEVDKMVKLALDMHRELGKDKVVDAKVPIEEFMSVEAIDRDKTGAVEQGEFIEHFLDFTKRLKIPKKELVFKMRELKEKALGTWEESAEPFDIVKVRAEIAAAHDKLLRHAS